MRPVWRIGPGRRLSFETSSYRLIIEAQAGSGCTRFLVLEAGGFPQALLGFGVKENVRAAMIAAERIAATFAGA